MLRGKHKSVHSTNRLRRRGKMSYCCEVRLRPERGGGYSAYVPTLPGALSQGENEREAIRNIAEAIAGVLACYKDHGTPIPWETDPERIRPREKSRWVIVHV